MRLFQNDERVLVLDDVSQLPQAKGFTGGLLCPYDPLSAEERTELLSFARKKVSRYAYFDSEESYDPLYPGSWKEHMRRYPPCLDRVRDELRACYNQVAGVDATTVNFRVNSVYPSYRHAHKDIAMVCAIEGAGSVGFNAQDMPYHTPLRHIFVIGSNFEHAAPAKIDPGDIRVTIILSRPEL